MTEPENLDERLTRLRLATDFSAGPVGLDDRVLLALAKLARWETVLAWSRKAVVMSAFAAVFVVALAAWHDDRMTNRVVMAGAGEDLPTGDP